MPKHNIERVILGRTGLSVTRSGFGALPVQRLSIEEGARLLRRAFDEGISFFDTARSYSDSEEKLGLALGDVWDDVVIATKTPSHTPEGIRADIQTSLSKLRAKRVDIYQLHNPPFVPDAEHPMYLEMLKLKEEGLIGHIGITCHLLTNAVKAMESGLYETIQYPLSALSSQEELDFVKEASARNIGLIGMKALCGGLLTSAAPSMAYLRPYPLVVPIWGVQKDAELDEILALEENPPELNEDMLAHIAKEREALSGDFCRGCGYCMPCPVGIPINNAARMPMLLRRSPVKSWVNETWDANMRLIEQCRDCGACSSRCPYKLDTPRLLRWAHEDYFAFKKEYESHGNA